MMINESMMIWIWCAIMLTTLVFEIVTVGNLVSIWFTLGAVVALFCALLNAPVVVQIAVFAVISAVLIILIRPMATKLLRGEIQPTNADRIINQHLRLTKEITEESWGEVKFGGTTWSATSYDGKPIVEGVLVTILAIEGSKVIVKRID